MASNYTSNYSLCQWEASDKVLRTEFNADNAKIDAAIKAVDSRVDGKASNLALSSLQSTVNGLKNSKADKTALDSVKTTVSQHTSTLDKKGNCQIYTTSYAGSGTYGSGSPTTLTFPKRPLLVFIATPNAMRGIFLQGQVNSFSDGASGGSPLTLTWSGNSVSWYHHSSAGGQLNESSYTYHVTALLKAD